MVSKLNFCFYFSKKQFNELYVYIFLIRLLSEFGFIFYLIFNFFPNLLYFFMSIRSEFPFKVKLYINISNESSELFSEN
jgi:hypothetical protein